MEIWGRVLALSVGGVLGVGQYEGKNAEIMPVWKKSIGELAACPNVNMKLGGLGMSSFPAHTGRGMPAADDRRHRNEETGRRPRSSLCVETRPLFA